MWSLGAVKLQNFGAKGAECGGANQGIASYGLWLWDVAVVTSAAGLTLQEGGDGLHQEIRGKN